MIQLLATLLLGHLVADFPLQTNTIVKLKHEGHSGILVHVLIYMGATAVLLQEPLRQLDLIVFLGVCHWIIDAIITDFKKSQKAHA